VAGCTITVENGRGLTREIIQTALDEAIARLSTEVKDQAA
jgi:hypothetical protein